MSGTIFIDGGPPRGLPAASAVSLTDGIVVAQGGTPGTPGSATIREATAAQLLATTAPLSSPAFTGTPTVPTAILGTNTTQAASTAFVTTNFAPLASPVLTGIPVVPTALNATATTQAASTAFVRTGTATNDSAISGQVGEYLTSTTGGGSLSTGISANATSISLTAGDWDVQGRTVFVASGGAAPTALETGISLVSGTFLGTGDGGGAQLLAASFNANTTNAVATSTTRVSIATTTTVFLVALAMFAGGAVSATGFIGARRAR